MREGNGDMNILCENNLFSIKKKMPHIVSIEIPFSLITLDCANKA